MRNDPDYGRERIRAVVDSLNNLWSATDYGEARDLRNYTDPELKAFLGQWIHVRKACNRIFDAIREARPDLPGWDPVQREKPVDERVAEAGDT